MAFPLSTNQLLSVGACVLLIASLAIAQSPMPFVVVPPLNASYTDYGAGNEIAARLRRAPPKMFTFDRASLRDLLRYLADDAGIPFVGIPENDSANKRLVTFTMEASAFTALESVCRDNGVRLTYENGVWYMHTVDEERERRLKEEADNELVGIAYKLRYDPVDRVDFRDYGGNSTAGTGAAAANTSSEASTPTLALQNSQRVFTSKAPRIVNEIRVMLGLPPITYNADGSVQGETPNAGTNVQSTLQTAQAAAESERVTRLNPTYVPPQMPQVIYNSDTNILWVVATRSQHKWVADYLLAVDLPQALIAIEVKFFETNKEPNKELGINWSGTLAGGYTIRAHDIRVAPAGDIQVQSTKTHQSQQGTFPPGEFPFDFNTADRTVTATVAAPYSAILDAGQVALSIQAFLSDHQTSMVQYPRVLTLNNREVAITSAVNRPIVSSQATVNTGAGAGTTSSGISYLPVGTQINILPKTVGPGAIALTVAITISSFDGDIPLNLGPGFGTQPYPVTSQRVYNAALQVESGYTLAVGGLVKVDDTRDSNGVPFLQDIPGVGEFFKSKTRHREKKNLIIFITPTVIRNPKLTTGISETPEAVIPIRPNDPLPPAFSPEGHLVGGAGGIDAAFAWLEYQLRYFKQINKENRTDKESIKKLRSVISTARMLAADIARLQEQAEPGRADELGRKEERAVDILTDLNKVLAAAQDNVM